MVSPGSVIVPGLQGVHDPLLIFRPEGGGEPAVAQRMPVCVARGDVVKRDDIVPSFGTQMAGKRSEGSCDDAQCQQCAFAHVGADLLRAAQVNSGPVGVLAQACRIGVHHKLDRDIQPLQIFSGHTSQTAGSVECQRFVDAAPAACQPV